MNIFRTAWKDWGREAILVAYSNRALMLGVLFSGLLAALNALHVFGRSETPSRGIEYFPLIVLFGVYYLFSPYVGAYEEAVLIVPLFLLLIREGLILPGLSAFFLYASLLILLNVPLLQLHMPMLFAWVVKGLYFLTLLRMLILRPLSDGIQHYHSRPGTLPQVHTLLCLARSLYHPSSNPPS